MYHYLVWSPLSSITDHRISNTLLIVIGPLRGTNVLKHLDRIHSPLQEYRYSPNMGQHLFRTMRVQLQPLSYIPQNCMRIRILWLVISLRHTIQN